MSVPDDCPKASHPISMGSRITLATVVVAAPFVAWAANVAARVDTLEKARAEERMEVRAEIRQINDKLDAIMRLVLARP